MKASEFVTKLQALIAEHGDLRVVDLDDNDLGVDHSTEDEARYPELGPAFTVEPE